MLGKPEYSGAAVGPGITTNSLEYTQPVMQRMRENVDIRIGPFDKFSGAFVYCMRLLGP